MQLFLQQVANGTILEIMNTQYAAIVINQKIMQCRIPPKKPLMARIRHDINPVQKVLDCGQPGLAGFWQSGYQFLIIKESFLYIFSPTGHILSRQKVVWNFLSVDGSNYGTKFFEKTTPPIIARTGRLEKIPSLSSGEQTGNQIGIPKHIDVSAEYTDLRDGQGGCVT